MNNRKIITLTICWILAVIPGLPLVSLAGNESETNAKAKQHFEKANELLNQKQYEPAIAELEEVINTSPNSRIAQDARYWMGQSQFMAGQYDDAEATFASLMELYPGTAIIPATKLMAERVQQTKEEKALFEAVEKGDIEQLKLLISKIADVSSVKDPNGMTLLHQAVRYGHADIVTLLINKGADVNAMDEHTYTKTPLGWAAVRGRAALAELLIAKGADVNVHGNYGHTPLEYAAAYGHLNVVELLLSKGAEVNAADHWNRTPLYVAAQHNHPEIVKLLLERRANIEARDQVRQTPLHIAARLGHVEVAKLLLDAGAYPDVRSSMDQTPLHNAVLNGHKEMADLLLAHGASLYRCCRGKGIVGMAMWRNQKEMVKFLIDKGVRQYSPIHVAAFFGDFDKVKSYLDGGGDIDAQEPSNQLTLLMCAMFGGQTELVKFLINKDADLNLQDGQGKTALRSAAQHGKVEIPKMLLEKGADVNIKDYYGFTPLNVHAKTTDTEVYKMMIAKGADVNAKGGPRFGDEGWTPLHDVCLAGNEAKAEALIAHGADVNAKTKNGKTPMWVAKQEDHKEIVELLRKHGAKE